MNGYDCPACTSLIAITKHGERRDCPSCKATVEQQRIIRVLRAIDKVTA